MGSMAPGARFWLLVSLFALLAGACTESKTVRCSNGLVCPEGTQCSESVPACVRQQQIDDCSGIADGGDCTTDTLLGTCKGGACFPRGCGDGVRRDNEQCDLDDLGETPNCNLLGYHDDIAVTCTPQCTYDVSVCVHKCGDGFRDPEEQCDGTDLSITSCQDLGYYDEAAPTCNAACGLDTSTCTGFCGDGVRNGPELCDGAPPAGVGSCIDFGYEAGTVGCAGFCGIDFAGCHRIGWTTVPGSEGFIDVRDLHGRADEVWAVGNNGFTAHFDGTAFLVVTTPTTQQLRGVWSSATTAYAAGTMGTILSYTGNGPWTAMTSGTTNDLWDIWGFADNDLYAVGTNKIVHYDGQTWSPLATGLTNAFLQGVWGSGPDDVWIVGNDTTTGGVVLHSTGGAFTPALSGLAFTPNRVDGIGNEVWVVGGYTILHYNGTTWTEIGSQTQLDSVSALGNGKAMFGAFNGKALYYDGTRLIPLPTTVPLRAVWASSTGDVFAAGDGPIQRMQGAGWSPVFTTAPFEVSSSLNPSFSGVDGTSGTDLFAVGSSGLILHFDGVKWTTMTSGTAKALNAVFTLNATTSYAVGEGGTILRFDGTSWSTVSSGTLQTLYDVWASSATDVFAVGASGTILHDTGSGFAPMSQPVGTSYRVMGIWGAASNDVYAVGDGNLVLHYDGANWTKIHGDAVPFANPLTDIVGTGPDDIYIVSAGFYLHYDGAGTFTQTSAPSGFNLLALGRLWADEIFASARDNTTAYIIPIGQTSAPSQIAPFPIRSFKLVENNVVVGVGPELGIVHANDEWDGATWLTPTYSTQPPPPLDSVFSRSAGDTWATSRLFPYAFHHDGTFWTGAQLPASTASVSAVYATPTDVFLTSTSDLSDWFILHDAGSGFVAEACAGAGELEDVTGSGSSVVAVGANGTICERNGASFTKVTSGTTDVLEGVWAASASEMFAVGKSGTALRRTSSGWGATSTNVTAWLYDVWGTSATNVIAVGTRGTILRWNGSVWTPEASGTSADLHAIGGSGPNDIFAAGDVGTLLHYDGAKWSPVQTDVSDMFKGVAVSGNQTFVVGALPGSVQAGSLRTLSRLEPW